MMRKNSFKRNSSQTSKTILVKSTLTTLLVCALSACAIGPDYVKPDLGEIPAHFKEDDLWKKAQPADTYQKDQWWLVFQDKTLNDLIKQHNAQNLTIAQAQAQYQQAQALFKQAQAGLFPQVGVSAARQRGVLNANSSAVTNQNQLAGEISWEVDLWGGIRRSVEAGKASEQAAGANLAAIRLSSQAQLATTYFELVITDLQIERLEQSEKLLEQTLKLIENQYQAGIASDADVAQAQNQYKVALSTTIDAKLSRKQLEHAIAVSIGKIPATFTLKRITAEPHLPIIPAGVPSELLQRRPDIAAAERRVASANAEIGVAKSAFFPSLVLTASGGWKSISFGNLFNVGNRIWAIGPQLAGTLFDGGYRSARLEQAMSAYDEQVIAYRQRVLTAFQEVEDQLVAQSLLAQEQTHQSDALSASKRSEQITTNQYNAGIVAYLNVIVAQNNRIATENTYWNIRKRQFVSSVALIAAIGGQWETTLEKSNS